MDDGPERRRPKPAAPAGLLGMLTLLLLVEMYVASRRFDFLTLDDFAYSLAAKKASKEVKDRDVLCFGDSLTKLTVVPKILERRAGLKAYNLALGGSLAPASYFLLHRAMASGARPKAVVVDFHPALLAVPARSTRERWPSLLRPIEAADLAWTAGDPHLFGFVAAARVLPSVRAREGVRASIVSAIRGWSASNSYSTFVGLRNFGVNDGAMLWEASPSMREVSAQQVEEMRAKLYSGRPSDPANALYVERFLALAAASGVRVYWLVPPHWPALHDAIAASGVEAEIERFLRGRLDRFPNLTIVDGRRSVFEPEGFLDLTHLSDRGAAAFTTALADVLRRPTAERWVRIPPLRVGPEDPALENLTTSKRTVESKATSLR